MGWCDETGHHDGYLVGLWQPDPNRGRLYELRYGQDNQPEEMTLRFVQVGCECGWRSPLLFAAPETEWLPYVVGALPWFEEEARKLWKEHVELETNRKNVKCVSWEHGEALWIERSGP